MDSPTLDIFKVQSARTSDLGHALPGKAGADDTWSPTQLSILWFYGSYVAAQPLYTNSTSSSTTKEHWDDNPTCLAEEASG